MAAVKMSLGELDFFPPSDRELALRAQIKTGWSTVALRKELKLADHYIPKNEMKNLQDVFTRAEAFNRIEEIRIGVQLMKYKQMKSSIRGNGTSSCLLCGFDFANQRTRRPVPLQFCDQCDKAMCPRCKVEEKLPSSGTAIDLCRLCYEEKELWKKSGAWLGNHMPVISIPEEELIKFQQLKSTGKKVTLGRRDSTPTEFINPYQLEAEDSDDDDDFGSGGSQISFHSSREGSPIPPSLSFIEGLNTELKTQSLPQESRLLPHKKHSTLERAKLRKRADTISGDLEESGTHRKGAMGGVTRKRLSSSRRRVRQKRAISLHQKAVEELPIPRPEDVEQEEGLSPLPDKSFPGVPTIRLRRPSTPITTVAEKQLAIQTENSQTATVSKSDDAKIPDRRDTESTTSESETQEMRSVHEVHRVGSETDDSTIPVADFESVAEQTASPQHRATSPAATTPTKRKPVPVPRKIVSDKAEDVSPSPTRKETVLPRQESVDIEWKKVSTPETNRKQSTPPHRAAQPSRATSEDVGHPKAKRPMLTDKGRQVSIASTISNISEVGSEDGSEGSMQQQGQQQQTFQSSEESLEMESPSKGYNWRRRNAKRVANRGGGGEGPSSPDVAAIDDFEQVSPESFRVRSGSFSRVHSGSVGEQSKPKKFQRSKSPMSPLAVESASLPRRERAKSFSPLNDVAKKAGSMQKVKRTSVGAAARSFDSRTHPDGAYGSIEATMHLDEEKNELKVTVLRCNGLRAMDASGYSDPYVKLFLIPGNKRYNFRTRVVHTSLNPEYGESFIFPAITKSSLEKKELCLVVMDRDEFSADDLIGSTRIKFYELLESRSLSHVTKMLLDDGRSIPFKGGEEDKERGQIELALSYHSKAQLLTLSVIRAKHLTPSDSSGSCDAYVKCLWSSQNVCAKKKTKVCSKTIHPDFNEDLEFQVQHQDLAYSKMVVTVWNKNKLTKDHMIGEVHFSESSFWKSFGKSASKTLVDWYTVMAP